MNDSDEFDFDEVAGDSNAGAYQKSESRTGPPLEYISEKLEGSLQALHHAIGVLSRKAGELESSAIFSLKASFQYQLVAFLALHNMLALANDHGLLERLLAQPSEQFENWTGSIKAEGSITG